MTVTRQDLLRAMQPTIGTGPQNGPMDARDIARALGIADDDADGREAVFLALGDFVADGSAESFQDMGQRQDESGTWIPEERTFYRLALGAG